MERLNSAVRTRADNIIANGYLVLVGDASGADSAMQRYLAEKEYLHVLIFCAGSTCRNNFGKWEVRFIDTERSQRDFQHYAMRDKKMSQEADYGFMLWDGMSKGTLNNILNMIEQGKTTLVYFAPKRKFFTIKSSQDFADLLALCDRVTIARFEGALKLSVRMNSARFGSDSDSRRIRAAEPSE